MKKIAIIYGGNSLESDVSVLTALKTAHEFDNNGWKYILVYLDHDGNFFTGKALLDKDNYEKLKDFKKGEFKHQNGSSYFKVGMKKYYFDYALILGHGKGIEDGTVGAYFDTLKIPCIYSGIYNASLLQDKALCKRVLSTFKIPQTKFKSLNVSTYQTIDFNLETFLKQLHFPLIVKPCHLGSSIGVSKVKEVKEAKEAIEVAFYYDDEVVIEEAIDNLKEVNIAILGDFERVRLSSLETVNNNDEVLSFADKYEKTDKSFTRIIPSDVDESIAEQIKTISIKVFKMLSCSGVVRFDFLYDQKNRKVYLNEINTIPGSLAYYLFEDQEIEFSEVLEEMLNIGIKRIRRNENITSNFEECLLKNLNSKLK